MFIEINVKVCQSGFLITKQAIIYVSCEISNNII